MAGGQGGPLKGADCLLKLCRLLSVDLHAERGSDLPHALKRRLLLCDNSIDLPNAEIGQKVRLIDRPLGVPDVGKLGARVRDGRGRRTVI